ncbi:MAG TPA: ribosome silencing factor [Candidatus Manganitrophaceae bacterium]|nr:ribosome silencing factor [Candidatus Manganitrophaceae bacterium]
MKKRSTEKTPWDAKKKALQIAEVAQSKHAEEIVVFHVSGLTSLADFFVLCSAESEPQMRAIVDAVEDSLNKKGARPYGVEGREAGLWVLLDYNDVILHIFKKEAREFYNLDRLWGDAPRIPFPEVPNEERPRVRKGKRG